MAALVIAAAGSAIGGSLITGTVLGLSGASIGYFAGSLLASALIKGPNSEGPRLGDLRVNGTEYGGTIPWVAGGPRIAGQIAWASDRREIANTQSVGKGGGGKVTNFTYEVDLLILLTENQIEGVSRVWLNGEMIYNGVAKEGVWNGITVYTGDPAQLPDPTYEAAVGAGNAPAYRGRGYVVIQGLQLGNSGQIPNLTFERGIPQPPSCNFQDFSLNEHPVTVGDPTNFLGCVPGVVGSAGSFNGNNTSGLRLGTTKEAASLGPGDVTLSCWLYYDLDYDAPFRFFSNRDGTGDNPGQYFETFFETGKIRMLSRQIGNNDWVEPDGVTASSIPKQEWFHFAFTSKQEEVRRFRMFINGVLDTEWVKPNDIDPVPPPFLDNTEVGMLGNADFGTLGWPGFIDEFFIESTALWTSSFTPPTTRHTVTTATQIYIPFSAIDTFTSATDTLEETTAALLTRAGYAADEFDVSALAPITQPVRGLALGQVTPTRGALEALQTGFLFEPAKSDKVYIRPRATTAVADIPFVDLGAAADPASDEDPFALTVGNELETPAQISLSYNNTAGDYNVANEHSDRLLSGQETNQVVQLGLGMLPAEAKGVADALLIDQIASITRTTLRLPLKYAFLEPGDVFTVTNADGREYRLRSTTKRDTLTIIEHECVVDDAGALTSAAITSSEYTSSETIAKIAPTIWEAMDIPMLRDADNAAGFYVAMAPDRAAPTDEWPGAVFARSWGGDAFDQLVTTSQPATMGACTTTLGNFSGGSGRFDEANTLTVRVTGQLANTTRADMLDDISINAALVGNEIIRFRLAELLGTTDGENEYRLSGLLRGQRGTEQHMGTHGAGERFVLLTPALRRVVNQTGEIGVASQVKAVTVNTLLSSVTAKPFVDTGVSLKPFSVANLRALKTNAGTVLTWQRRTRLDYRYGGTTGVSVPLGEASELYRVDVFSASNFVSTRTVSSPAFTYSAAQLAADGLLNDTGISFAVRQVSASVGPGFPSTVGTPAPDFSTIPSTPLAPTTPPAPGVPTDPGVGGGGGGAPVLSRQSVWPFGKAGSTGLAVRYAEYGSLKTWRVLESANNGASFTPLAGDANVPLTSYPSGRACRSDGVYVSVQLEDVENPRVSTVTVVRGAAGSAPVRTGKVFSRGNMPIGVACDGTKFLIFAEGNQMWSSTDGINWTLSGAVSGLPFIASSVFAAQSQSNPLGSFGSNYSGAYFGYYAGRWFLHIFNTLYYNTSATPLTGWTPCVLPSVTAPNQAQFGSNYRIAEVGGALFATGILYNGSPNDFLTKGIERWILKSTDSGATWTTVFTFPAGFAAGAYVSLAGSRLVSVGNDFSSTSYVSDDSGATWAASANGQTYVGTAYPEVMGANIVMQTVQGRDTFGYNNDVLVYSTNGVAFTNSTYI